MRKATCPLIPGSNHITVNREIAKLRRELEEIKKNQHDKIRALDTAKVNKRPRYDFEADQDGRGKVTVVSSLQQAVEQAKALLRYRKKMSIKAQKGSGKRKPRRHVAANGNIRTRSTKRGGGKSTMGRF